MGRNWAGVVDEGMVGVVSGTSVRGGAGSGVGAAGDGVGVDGVGADRFGPGNREVGGLLHVSIVCVHAGRVRVTRA